MRTERLDYYLPPELIAQHPVDARSDSRLLVFNRSSGRVTDSRFDRIGDFLSGGDCLVLNDTKVLPARFFGLRSSGGRLEGLFLAEGQKGMWEVMLKGARKVRVGETIYLRPKEHAESGQYRAVVLEKKDSGRCLLKIDSDADFETVLNDIGFPPLPPYIKRGEDLSEAKTDRVRYQTVYARQPGAVAAPTAGLHFTDELIEQLKSVGVVFAYVTLHVGPGTFKPITAETLEEHKMEAERYSIDAENAGVINAAKTKGRRIVAVGTTSVRTLETAAEGAKCQAGSGETELFITPGYRFKLVDGMVTNFHLPGSTLLALAAAFAGLENILAAYDHAIKERYRFYSYGDAMLIL